MRTKILLITDFYPPNHIGGDAVHVKYLKELLEKKNYKVDVLVNMTAMKFKGLNKKLKEKNIYSINGGFCNFRLFCAKYFGFGFRKHVEDFIKKGDYDVLHFHNINLFGNNILKIKHNKKIYTIHDKNYKRVPDDTIIICPNRILYHSIFSKNKIFLPNFIPKPIAKSKNNGYYLYLGVLEKHKGIKTLVNAFNNVGKTLIIVGEGKLRKWILKHKKSNIKVFGKKSVEKCHNLLSGCKALVLPSHKENCPISILEALAYKKPIICREIPQLSDIPAFKFSSQKELEELSEKDLKCKKPKKIFTSRYYIKKYRRLICDSE